MPGLQDAYKQLARNGDHAGRLTLMALVITKLDFVTAKTEMRAKVLLCYFCKDCNEMTRALNHVAVSVTDIKLAMEWYRDVMGMSVLLGPVEISASDGTGTDPHLSNLVRQVFGPGLGKFLICHLASANGVGIELFQFLDPPAKRREDNFEYWKSGYFHIAVTEPQIEQLVERISSSGGRRRTEILELSPGCGKKICFCEDPFGNIIEIYSHSYEQFWANVEL